MRHAILNVQGHNREADMRYAFLSGMAARENDLAAAQERIAELEAALISAQNALLGCRFPAGEDLSSVDRRAKYALDEINAALAGSQGGGGEDGQDVACTETVHRVQEGADACVCGENRMELML